MAFLYLDRSRANLVSWLIPPRNAVSIGASGAVFGLFAISVLVKMSWDWRKILESTYIGTICGREGNGSSPSFNKLSRQLQRSLWCTNVNHIIHLLGALVGVVLIWLLSRVSPPVDETQRFNLIYGLILYLIQDGRNIY